jgi:hypothetical protein
MPSSSKGNGESNSSNLKQKKIRQRTYYPAQKRNPTITTISQLYLYYAKHPISKNKRQSTSDIFTSDLTDLSKFHQEIADAVNEVFQFTMSGDRGSKA